MSTLKRVVLIAIASVLVTTVVRADRVYAADPSQQRGDDRDQRRGNDRMRWGSDPMPRAGACFFEDKDFRGQYFCVENGEALAELPPGTSDRISSLRILDNVDVVVFKDVGFEGPSGRFLTDVRDLRREGWNDQISSLRVTTVAVAWGRDRVPVWGNEEMPREGACFYRDADFRGDYFCMPRGASYAMVPQGFNDKISSIRLLSAGGVSITEDRDFGGRGRRLTSDVADLRQADWNDRISSIRVF